MENAGLATSAGLRSLWSERNSQGSRCMLLRSGEYVHCLVGLFVQPVPQDSGAYATSDCADCVHR